MGSIYDQIASVTERTCKDPKGLIQAVLQDLTEDLDYQKWMTLVGIIKYEVQDEQEGFEIFDEFSSRFSTYNPDETYKKFFSSGIQGNGSAKLGSLLHWAKESNPEFTVAKYNKYFDSSEVSAVRKLSDKIRKAKNALPDHILTEEIDRVPFPSSSISPELALTRILEPNHFYATATHPSRESSVDPYAGGKLEQYISVNPILKGEKRNQKNCANFKRAVIEFDSISLDEQFSILSAVELPYEALVFTGNKSIHAWVRIDAPDLETYKQRTKLLNKMFCDFGYSKERGKGVDTLVLYDPCSWVRCPGVARVSLKEKDAHTTGNIQRAIWAGESKGWNHWYDSVYPKYVVESSLQEVEEAFAVPEKDVKFTRKLNQIKDGLDGQDFLNDLKNILQGLPHDKVSETLNEAITSFLQHIRKKAKIRVSLTVSDLYHIFEESLLQAGTLYEGDVREALLEACKLAEHFELNRKREYKDKLESEVESIKGKINKWVDPELVREIDRSLQYAKDQGEEEYEEVLRSIEELFEDLDFRTAVLKKPELYKYAEVAGSLLSSEFKESNKSSDDIFYVYYDELQTFDRKDAKFEKVTTYTFPSVVTPYICFVQKDMKGKFKAVPLDDNSVAKLLASYQFLSSFKKVEVISKVPVFNEGSEGPELITGYNEDKKVLVVGDREGYEFMDLEEAKKLIVDLFSDFKFVSPSDLSRAIACLFMPAMCHAGLLRGDYRPLAYIDADKQGAGKGTMVDFLTCPYVDSYALVTQDDASIGSIDEKIASSIKEGKNHVVLDNLKPTRKMKELSSSFIEAMMTANSISFRCAGERMTELDLRWSVLYVTTNGMPLSKDTAERSLYISIRKQEQGHTYRKYESGLKNWLIEQRPKIMSAIFTILKEYVEKGKPLRQTAEGHRFLYSVPAVNYIIMDIFDLPDVTSGIRQRNEQKSAVGSDVIRAICFCVEEENMLGEELNHLDLFELMARQGKEQLLELGIEDLYADESGEILTTEAKRKIGTKLGILFSKPSFLGLQKKTEEKSCCIEEFTITRFYDLVSKGPRYRITKE